MYDEDIETANTGAHDMTKAQKIYREFRKYLARSEARYATVKFVEIYKL